MSFFSHHVTSCGDEKTVLMTTHLVAQLRERARERERERARERESERERERERESESESERADVSPPATGEEAVHCCCIV